MKYSDGGIEQTSLIMEIEHYDSALNKFIIAVE